MALCKVTPIEGRLVRDPSTRAEIPADGLVVERSSDWERSFRRGDIKLEPVAEAPETDAAPKAEPKSKKG